MEPFDLLDSAMRRAGLNPNSLAAATGGQVSATTVRSYLRGGPTTRAKLFALAKVLADSNPAAVEAAAKLLDAHGFADLAESILERSNRLAPVPPSAPPPLSREAADLIDALARWLAALEHRLSEAPKREG